MFSEDTHVIRFTNAPARTTFTILEMVVALALFTFVMAGTFTIFSQGFRSSRKSVESATVVHFAKGILEQYSDWDELDDLDGSGDGTVTDGAYASPPDPDTINDVTYTPTLTISSGPVDNNRLKKLSLSVVWGTDAFTIETMKAEF